MSKISKKILSYLPRTLRYEFFRRTLALPRKLPDGLEIKLAESRDEYTQAFKILHDSYVDAGFMKKDPSGLRVTLYHLLKSTSTYVAVDRGEVIATMAMVRDSSFGLPMDKIYALEGFRNRGERIGEVSALAIRRDYRGHGGELLFCLIRLMWLHTLSSHRIDNFVIAVNPQKADLYRSILYFHDLPGHSTVDQYSFVQGAPAVGQWMNVKNSYETFEKAYAGKAPGQNIFDFLFRNQEEFLKQQIDSPYFTLFNQTLIDAQMRRYFLKDLSNVWEKTSEQEKQKFANSFDLKNPEDIFKSELELTPIDLTRQPRIEVDCPVRKFAVQQISQIAQVGVLQDLSPRGFKLLLRHKIPLELNSKANLEIALGPNLNSKVQARLSWYHENRVGFEVLAGDSSWADLSINLDSAGDRRKTKFEAA